MNIKRDLEKLANEEEADLKELQEMEWKIRDIITGFLLREETSSSYAQVVKVIDVLAFVTSRLIVTPDANEDEVVDRMTNAIQVLLNQISHRQKEHGFKD